MYDIEPWGDDWEQAAKTMAANQQLWTKRSVDYRQFLPNYSKIRRSPEEIEREMTLWGKRHNAAVERREREASARPEPKSPPAAKPRTTKKPKGR